MQVLIEEIDYEFYAEMCLSKEDLDAIMNGEMVSGSVIFNRRKWHMGVYGPDKWDLYPEEQDDDTNSNEDEAGW